MKLSEFKINGNEVTSEDINNIVNSVNKIFNDFKDNLTLGNKKIIFSRYNIGNYNQDFLHISSLESKTKYDGTPYYTILPCNNTIYCNICNNCNTHRYNITIRHKNRNKCLYRLSSIHIIPEIINLCNNDCKNIKLWILKEISKGQLEEYVKIRYQFEDIDYLLIFKNSTNFLYFITAYPVFEYREKKDLDLEFSRSKK